MITISQSLTGALYFRQDERVVWVSRKEYGDAIADFNKRFNTDYNPNQPRDARGRWSSGGGGGGGSRGGSRGGGGGSRGSSRGGGGGLANKRVSELQEIAKKEGIDVASLSYKNRKSVLTKAIKAKRQGQDLRKAGVLKAKKVESSLAKKRREAREQRAQSKKATSQQSQKPTKLVGDTADVVTDKKEFDKLYQQWKTESKTQQRALDVLDSERNIRAFRRNLNAAIANEKDAITIPSELKLSKKAIKDNHKFHQDNKSLEVKRFGGSTTFNSDLADVPLSVVLEQSPGKYTAMVREANTNKTKTLDFNDRKEAEDFAQKSSQSYLASRIFPTQNADKLLSNLEKENVDSIRNELKQKGITDTSRANIERIDDNRSIHQSVADAATYDETSVLAVKDKRGNLQSALAYELVPDFDDNGNELKGSKTLYVEYLATAPWNAARANDDRVVSGAGARAIAEAVKEAEKVGAQKVQLTALDGAKPFYKRIGMSNDKDDSFFELELGTYKAKELVAKYG